MDEGITVNDGKGLFDSDGLIDTLIIDLNKLPKSLIDGQFIHACNLIASMGQRLSTLKNGMKEEVNGLRSEADFLRKRNEELMQEIEKTAGGNGGN